MKTPACIPVILVTTVPGSDRPSTSHNTYSNEIRDLFIRYCYPAMRVTLPLPGYFFNNKSPHTRQMTAEAVTM